MQGDSLPVMQITVVCQVVISVSALYLHVDMELGVQVKLQQWPITPTALLGLLTMLILEVKFCLFLNTLLQVT